MSIDAKSAGAPGGPGGGVPVSRDAGRREFDDAIGRALSAAEPFRVRGKVIEALGSVIKAAGVQARVGETCELRDRADRLLGIAEVVGFSERWMYLSALSPIGGLSPQVEVAPLGTSHRIAVGAGLRGRVLDGFGTPIDGLGELQAQAWAAVDADPPDTLRRQPVSRRFETGLRTIDALLTCGIGQRMAVIAPPGAGKSTLIGTLARQAEADTVVVALVGERGREVGDFVRSVLDAKGRERCVVVAATSDRSAIERVKAAQVATAIAEHFRDRGEHVLLLVDSLTRLARAQREIGLAMGEPPTRRGYPPSLFTMLPRLLERAGPGEQGAITAFYSVLVEGEDADDPVGEEVRAIVDGHLVLSRRLAGAGHYPAIEVLESASRVMDVVASARHCQLAGEARALLARHRELELLVQIGEFRKGVDAQADRALAVQPRLQALMKQRAEEPASLLAETLARLEQSLLSAP